MECAAISHEVKYEYMDTQTIAGIERLALGIPSDARLRLAAKLLFSVKGAAHSNRSEEEALDLAEERAQELDRGEVEGRDYREEITHIRSSLSR